MSTWLVILKLIYPVYALVKAIYNHPHFVVLRQVESLRKQLKASREMLNTFHGLSIEQASQLILQALEERIETLQELRESAWQKSRNELVIGERSPSELLYEQFTEELKDRKRDYQVLRVLEPEEVYRRTIQLLQEEDYVLEQKIKLLTDPG